MVVYDTIETGLSKREISQFWPVGNTISTLVVLKFGFSKKVKDFYMVDHTAADTDRRYVFVMDDNTLSLYRD